MPEFLGMDGRVEAVRRFNRFYTNRIGLLQDGFLRQPFTLTEARVVFELAQHERTTATHLGSELGMNPGHLSRILKALHRRGIIERTASETDRRQAILSLTPDGEAAFARLNAASAGEIDRMLSALPASDRDRLVQAMGTILDVLRATPAHRAPYILRTHQPGDMGWVVERHGALYAQEYGFDARFEALVAEIVAAFLREFDARRERCWIAEKDGARVGSVFLVRHPERDGVAKLRLLLVEPTARGLGIGRRLVAECTRFARQSGYHTITLWTNSVLDAARHLYVDEGYHLVREEPHRLFGTELTGQTWELALTSSDATGG